MSSQNPASDAQTVQSTTESTATGLPQVNNELQSLLDNIDPNTPHRELYDDLQRSLECKYMISTLEPGWKIKKDAQGRIYFAHPEFKATQWEQPEDIRYLQLRRELEALQNEAAAMLTKASPKE